MENESSIVIPVRMDERTFKRFARFDLLSLKKRWVRPAVFSLIMILFAFAALLLRKEQSGMIAAVLLVIGIGLPIVYLGTFFSQVNMQAVQRKLKPPRLVYTVTLRESGVRVENNQKMEDPLEAEWSQFFRAFRVRGCIYLYLTAAKAFLLPDGQANAPDDVVWRFLQNRIGADKCKNTSGRNRT